MRRRSMSSSAHQSTAVPLNSLSKSNLPNLAHIYLIFFALTMKWSPKAVIPRVADTKLALTRWLSPVSTTSNYYS